MHMSHALAKQRSENSIVIQKSKLYLINALNNIECLQLNKAGTKNDGAKNRKSRGCSAML